MGADVVGGDVDDRKSDNLVRIVSDDSLGPRVGLGLAAVFLDGVTEAGLTVGRQLEVVGGEDLDGFVVCTLARVEVSDRVLAVVRDVLRTVLAQQLQEGQLNRVRLKGELWWWWWW